MRVVFRKDNAVLIIQQIVCSKARRHSRVIVSSFNAFLMLFAPLVVFSVRVVWVASNLLVLLQAKLRTILFLPSLLTRKTNSAVQKRCSSLRNMS